ncbi:hypothetical protein DITRI_Ditri18aG0021700 [Diplodiscus trichospermus]
MDKWVWHNKEENDTLWRLVIEGKYGGSHQDLLPKLTNARKLSILWKNIISHLTRTSDYQNSFDSSYGFTFRNGNSSKAINLLLASAYGDASDQGTISYKGIG